MCIRDRVETPKGFVKNEVSNSVAISSDKVGVKMAANKTNNTENVSGYIMNSRYFNSFKQVIIFSSMA